jgi:hypothetical protein
MDCEECEGSGYCPDCKLGEPIDEDCDTCDGTNECPHCGGTGEQK